jgi:hypothetical protein
MSKEIKNNDRTLVTGNKPANKMPLSKSGEGFIIQPGGTTFNKDEWEDLSLPPVIKAKDFPVGSALLGKILMLQSTEIPDTKPPKKGLLVILETSVGKCAIPGTAVVIRSLQITGVEEGKPESPFIGRDMLITATGQRQSSKKGMRDFWGFDVKVKKA